MIFDQGTKAHNGEKNAFSINGAEKVGKPYAKE